MGQKSADALDSARQPTPAKFSRNVTSSLVRIGGLSLRNFGVRKGGSVDREVNKPSTGTSSQRGIFAMCYDGSGGRRSPLLKARMGLRRLCSQLPITSSITPGICSPATFKV